MKNIKEGDVRFYHGTPVTVCRTYTKDGEQYAHIKWFVESELYSQEVPFYKLSLLKEEPLFEDYFVHIDVTETTGLSTDSASDDLEEILVTEAFHALLEHFPEQPEDKILEAVYSIKHRLESPFYNFLKYIEADGYQAALYDLEEKDEVLAKELKEDVLKSARKYPRE